jgi:predicted nucleotidyltransferase
MDKSCDFIRETIEDNRDQIKRIAARHGARQVRIFGSVARGDTHSQSDLDLLVKLDPDRSLLDLIALKQDLEDLLGCQVDVLTEAAISPYIRDEVLRESVDL